MIEMATGGVPWSQFSNKVSQPGLVALASGGWSGYAAGVYSSTDPGVLGRLSLS